MIAGWPRFGFGWGQEVNETYPTVTFGAAGAIRSLVERREHREGGFGQRSRWARAGLHDATLGDAVLGGKGARIAKNELESARLQGEAKREAGRGADFEGDGDECFRREWDAAGRDDARHDPADGDGKEGSDFDDQGSQGEAGMRVEGRKICC